MLHPGSNDTRRDSFVAGPLCTQAPRGATRGFAATSVAAAALFSGGAPAEDADLSRPEAFAATSGDSESLPDIEVTGTAVTSDHDIPQSVDTIDARELAEQNVSRLQDALRNVPGITFNAGEGGAHGDSVNLRGLSVPDSFFLDGLRDIGQYQRDTFNQDAIAVLLGPASVLFGRGSTAGVINAVSKQPLPTPLAAVSLSAGSADLVRATGDFNWAFRDTAAARIALMDERSGVEERDLVSNRREGVAPTVALGMGTPTRTTLSYLHQEENNVPDYGIPFIDGAPAPVNRSNYYGLGDYDRTRTDVNVSTARVEHDFNDSVTISDSLRYATYGFEYLLSAPHLDDDYTEPPPPGTPLADIVIYRDQPSSAGTTTQLIDRADLTGKFTTGEVTHTLATGIELSRETSNVTRYVNGIDVIAPTPLLAPNPYDTPPTPLEVDTLPRTRGTDVSVFATDSIGLSPHWDLDAGLRWDRFDSHYSEATTGSAFTRVDTEVGPRVALIYKPGAAQSYYLSYGTSYNPAIEYLTLAPTNASLAPEEDRTLEAGMKLGFLGGRLNVTGALFDTHLSNARIADPDDPTIQQMPFNQEVKGVELGASGYVTKIWELRAGFSHLDDRITATSDPMALGKEVPNTPQNALTLWSTVEITPAWTVGGGFNAMNHRYADTDNTAGVPAYAVFNAMTSYRLGEHVSLQANLNNLTNKLYYTSIYYSAADENHAVPGAGRTLLVTLNAHF
jgi:catecholate siderophore receptor